jgi:hypothetical protein
MPLRLYDALQKLTSDVVDNYSGYMGFDCAGGTLGLNVGIVCETGRHWVHHKRCVHERTRGLLAHSVDHLQDWLRAKIPDYKGKLQEKYRPYGSRLFLGTEGASRRPGGTDKMKFLTGLWIGVAQSISAGLAPRP